MTRVFDNPETFSDEALAGFAIAYPDYAIQVDGGFVRATPSQPGQVAVVIGGGSGHYPAFAGLVGSGLATAAVCGKIFASPSAGQVYRVARAADSGGGVLFSYGNYAGDRMQFGQAEQRLRSEGIDTRTVIVTDDIASAPIIQMGDRRGIAGGLAVFKIAGAAADLAMSIEEVEHLALKANTRTRSLGVAFDGCTLPGAPHPLFTVPPGKMSIGLGIHGEAGISEMPIPSAGGLAELLVTRLLRERPEGAADRAVVLVNGLGDVKYEELLLLFGKVATRLTQAGVEIVDAECGELITSLDMSGLSLTLFWVDEELEALWLAPADTPAYHKVTHSSRDRRRIEASYSAVSSSQERATAASQRLGRFAERALKRAAQTIRAHEQELGDLDTVAGDGDHGTGMRRGTNGAAEAAHAALQRGAGIRGVLIAAGENWSEQAGGTSGALWGSALMAMATSLGNRASYQGSDLLEAVAASRDCIIALGKAEMGDKTILDALCPFVDTLSTEISNGSAIVDAFRAAADVALCAAAETALLRPRKGRARPLADRSVGNADPGAQSFALIVATLAEQPTVWFDIQSGVSETSEIRP